MASVKSIKKDIDYLVEEVVTDCYLALYFHPDKKDESVGLIEIAVDVRNELFSKANNPVEKHNKSLVKKHYAQLRSDMFERVDGMFSELSQLSK